MDSKKMRQQIGHNIKFFREQQNLSKVELAERVTNILHKKISNTSFTPWEQGLYSPNTATTEAICKALNISFNDLIYGTQASIEANKIISGKKIAVLGTIPAGIPIESIQDILDYEEIPEAMAQKGQHFALKIKGNSMSPNILEGDIVIFRQCDDAENGDTCAIMVNGNDATIKKIRKNNNGIYLIPNNAQYEPLFFTNEEIENKPVRIIGKAVEIRRSL